MAFMTGELLAVRGRTSSRNGFPLSSRKTMRWLRLSQKWATSARRFVRSENSEKAGM